MKNVLMMLPLALAIGAATQVQADQSGLELTAGWNHTNWDKDRGIKDSTGWLGGLGYRINDSWGIEGFYVENDSTVESSLNTLETRQMHFDALYHFNTDTNVQPFFLFGAGKSDYKLLGAKDDESTFNVGAGIKFFLTDNFILRGDMRGIRGSENGDIDLGTNLALSYFFGDRGTKPAPVVAAAAVPSDADNDGVVDTKDACPQTPAGVKVDAKGCALDSDKDGVADHKDQCPNTESGLKVDAVGCAISLTEAVAIKLNVTFDNNAAVVKPAFFSEIGAVATFMKSYKDSVVEVQGYTDSRGSDAYNQALSQKRANAVRDVLVQEYGVAAERVTAKGYGEANPIADNETAEGREANRRVVASVQSQKTTNVKK